MVGGTTPPQSDSGEISRVLVLNLLWQSKRCSRTAQDISILTTPSLLSRGTLWIETSFTVGHRRETGKVGQLARAPNEKTTPFRPAGKRCFLLVHLVIREDLDAVPLSE